MFWSKNKKQKTQSKAGQKAASSKVSQAPAAAQSAALRAQALENARMARAHIGEDTIQKLAEAMTKKQESVIEQSKAQIAQQDARRVAEELLSMVDER